MDNFSESNLSTSKEMIPLKITDRNKVRQVRKSILDRIIEEKKAKIKENKPLKRSQVLMLEKPEQKEENYETPSDTDSVTSIEREVRKVRERVESHERSLFKRFRKFVQVEKVISQRVNEAESSEVLKFDRYFKNGKKKQEVQKEEVKKKEDFFSENWERQRKRKRESTNVL